MPITSSAKKALRQNLRRRTRNLAHKDSVKTAVKTLKKLVAEKKGDEAKAQLQRVYKALDKTAKVGLIKKNKASRLKSRLARLVNKR